MVSPMPWLTLRFPHPLKQGSGWCSHTSYPGRIAWGSTEYPITNKQINNSLSIHCQQSHCNMFLSSPNQKFRMVHTTLQLNAHTAHTAHILHYTMFCTLFYMSISLDLNLYLIILTLIYILSSIPSTTCCNTVY